MRHFILSIFTIASIASSTFAQNRIGTGEVDKLYQSICASCHGEELRGGLGGSLLDKDAWKQVGKTQSFMDYVKEGNLEMGMPSFEGALTDPQIRSLEIYIDEVIQKTAREDQPLIKEIDGVYSAGGYQFKVETILDGLNRPWSVVFFSEDSGFITEKGGNLRMFCGEELGDPVRGIPEVWAQGQGGLLEVALHPDYPKTPWVYLSYSASGGEVDGKAVGMTKVVRGRISNNQWSEEQVIFEAPLELHRVGGAHFGSRFAFKDGYLFFSIGDRGSMEMAQDLSKPNGKIHRVHEDGRVPTDNPFVNVADAYPTIWTYGNRNPQGLDIHPATGELWESEHGPRGGDEINVLEGGKNYGWPTITYGMHYNGKPITEKTSQPGMEQPKHYWTPSIAVCGIDFYEGDAFPEWKNQLLVGGLASQELHLLEIEEGRVIHDTIILHDVGRVRDVASAPNGYIYLVLDKLGKLVRLVPTDSFE
ncbi:MAG TPA: secretion protein HlyD [Opitutae bacterium]|nr:secretion protein HlyD [Opitutae bacterium]